jgi:peptidoglycan/LPS O-acetylase OafA/YrhL
VVTSVAIYAVLLAASALAYHAIEEPGRRWVRQLRGVIPRLPAG